MERDLTPAEVAFVSEARVGHLGTQRMGRWPHVVPVCHVLDLDRIVIASAFDEKISDIRDNASVTYCVDVYSEDWDDGLAQVIMSGEAYLIESGPEFDRDRGLLYEKFPQYERVAPIEVGTTVIIEFRVQQVHSNGVGEPQR
jgi:nitroimidazol reductase NimA-like FMN-containing flavoprotein (pyridoxamine 5'-phosphate oxidase superfamily)